jgi:hypothetical protein
VGAREDLFVAAESRLALLAGGRELALALEPGALAEARRLAEVVDDDGDLRARFLLGWLLWRRSQARPPGERQQDLDDAVSMLARCFSAGCPGSDLPEPLLPWIAHWVATGADAVLEMALSVRDPDLIPEAVRTWRRIVSITPEDHPDRPGHLTRLAIALHAGFERAGDPADLDQAIDLLGAAAVATPARDPDRAVRLSDLGVALRTRFKLTGTPADLDWATKAGQAAVTTSSAGDRPRCMLNLAATLQVKYEQTGSRAALDEAVNVSRAALAAVPADDPERAGILSTLAATLVHRFEETGARADIDEGIEAGRAAVAATPANHPDRAGRLANLGAALRRRFVLFGAAADLDAAITAGRGAADLVGRGHPMESMIQANLSIALSVRFDRTGSPADLDEAIAAAQAAVGAAAVGHPNRAGYLSCLSHALVDRFDLTGRRSDLDAAVNAAQAAASVTVGQSQRALILDGLGSALRTRSGISREWGDLDAARAAYREAAGVESAEPSTRIRAARRAAALTADADPGQAADLIETAVRLLPEVTPQRIDRRDRQRQISALAGLPGEAAALALDDAGTAEPDRATRALRLLEASRAVLISQALDSRSDLTELQHAHPGLAERFASLRARLDQPADDTAALAALVAGLGQPAGGDTDRHRLAADLASTMAEIRTLDGFASFGLPPTTSDLLDQGQRGPIVTFTINPRRSDALLLTENGITALGLPGLAFDDLTSKIGLFREALHATTLLAPPVARSWTGWCRPTPLPSAPCVMPGSRRPPTVPRSGRLSSRCLRHPGSGSCRTPPLRQPGH